MRIVAGLSVTAAIVFAGAAPGLAASPNPSPSRVSRTFLNDECSSAIEKANKSLPPQTQISLDECRRSVELITGPTEVVDSTLSAADSTLPESLKVALSAGTVRSTYFRQTVYQGTDQENQSGRFYWDGSYSWLQVSYRGYSGWHDCWVSYAIGYSVDVTACNSGGRRSGTNYAHMRLKVTPLNKLIPISWNEDYHAYFNRSGNWWQ